MVPYEAFLSHKPVITTRDAGGPLEVVEDGRTGLVCEADPAAIAEACAWLAEHRDQARNFGRAGGERAQRVTWAAAIDRLLEP
jgi:glycosyltransferase involved in cell wall biosynthesis